MGLTSSLFVGLSGMQTNESRMDVIGNNISNVNTYAFKSQRVNFQSQFYNMLNFGSAPNGAYGGTNPMEIGTGATVGAITKDFSGGAPETTGIKSDLAIQGDGMFIVQDTEGANHYTRDGSFQFNSENYLLSSDGFFLQGYGVDANFNIVEGTLSKLRVPLGEITTAESTSKTYFAGDFNASGISAMDRSSGTLEVRANLRGVQQSQILNVGGADITDATLLTDVEDATGPRFDVGNFINMANAQKGSATLPEEQFLVEATSTVGDLMAWMEDVLGINTSTSLSDLDGDGLTDTIDNEGGEVKQPGVRLATDPTAVGAQTYIEIVSNMGPDNQLDFNGSEAFEIIQGAAVNKYANNPLTFAEPDGFTIADVEGVKTSFRAYDSLGIPMDVDLTIVMVDKTDNGITWRYFAESTDDTDADRVVGSGTITFDPNGNFLESSNSVITIDRTNTGAATPQTISLDFSNMDGYSMNTSSAISLQSQDGFQSGTLQDYSIGTDGIITGSFTNGLTRQLGQVVLATFRNYAGLLNDKNNLYSTGPNSGQPIIKRPQELGAGALNSTALELSNVDLSKEFINLIVSSTGFSASSKVIQTSNDLLTQLINMTR